MSKASRFNCARHVVLPEPIGRLCVEDPSLPNATPNQCLPRLDGIFSSVRSMDRDLSPPLRMCGSCHRFWVGPPLFLVLEGNHRKTEAILKETHPNALKNHCGSGSATRTIPNLKSRGLGTTEHLRGTCNLCLAGTGGWEASPMISEASGGLLLHRPAGKRLHARDGAFITGKNG